MSRPNTNGGARWRKRMRRKLGAMGQLICPCGVTFTKETPATIDHIIPVSKGGTSQVKNLQLLCYACNFKKDDKLPKEARK